MLRDRATDIHRTGGANNNNNSIIYKIIITIMKFSCTKSDLERAAATAERFTGKQLALPALAHILVSTDARGLTLTATNLEHAVELRVPARVSREGRVAIPAKVFASLLQSLGDADVQGEGVGGKLRLMTGTRDVRLNGSPADDFPLVPKIKKTGGFSVDMALLSRGVARVLPAVSSSEFKPELSGVYFRQGKDSVTLCATDTFRLAEAVVPLAKSGDGGVSFILPHRSASELSRLLEGEEGEASLVVGDSQLTVETRRGVLTSRLVDGAFPDYKAIIPARFATSAYLSREDALRGARAASIFASKLQEITLHLAEKRMDIKAANPDVGEYHVTYPVSLTGKETAMSFNWRYVLDGLAQMDDEEIFFGCNDAGAPALIRNKSNAAFTYVVMPIRLT